MRSLCELERIPVQMANEDFSGIWHLRETQSLVSWVQGRNSHLGGQVPRLKRMAGPCSPPVPWMDLLSEAIEEYDLETGGGENSVEHFIEWLAEWGRDARRRQRGLLLLTAHRAKGLEFDHVVVLDGGWDRVGSRGGPGCPATAVLRGHDPRSSNHHPRAPSRPPSTPGRLEGRPVRAASPAAGRPAGGIAGAGPPLPAAQPARRVSELRWIQAPRRSGAPRHCLSIARVISLAGTSRARIVGNSWTARGRW